jgi:hypothetical protein
MDGNQQIVSQEAGIAAARRPGFEEDVDGGEIRAVGFLQVVKKAVREQASLAWGLYKDDGIGSVMVAVWLVWLTLSCLPVFNSSFSFSLSHSSPYFFPPSLSLSLSFSLSQSLSSP